MKSKEMYAATKMADLTKFVDHFDRLTKFGKLKILSKVYNRINYKHSLSVMKFCEICLFDYYMHFCT